MVDDDTKHILRLLVLPLALRIVGLALFIVAAVFFPLYAAVVFACFVLWIVLREIRAKRRDFQRGWRVGHAGRDMLFYEELNNGQWLRIDIAGDILLGNKPGHLIRFPTRDDWAMLPEWTQGRREEIVERIKSEYREPYYKYEEGS